MQIIEFATKIERQIVALCRAHAGSAYQPKQMENLYDAIVLHVSESMDESIIVENRNEPFMLVSIDQKAVA